MMQSISLKKILISMAIMLLGIMLLVMPLSAGARPPKTWPDITFHNAPPGLPTNRQRAVQERLPIFPASRNGDKVKAYWDYGALWKAVGHYTKRNELLSLAWYEDLFTNPNELADSLWGGFSAGWCNLVMGMTGWCTPLLLDTARNGFNLGEAGRGVYFDILGTGEAVHMQWVANHTDDAFLAIDLNANGLIDNGSELFGSGTVMLQSGDRATNGYDALAQYDAGLNGGNSDGKISAQDAVWERLRLWIDQNADGISHRHEIVNLAQYKIRSIDLLAKRSPQRLDSAGNAMPYWSWVSTERVPQLPDKMKMVDVYFRVIGVP